MSSSSSWINKLLAINRTKDTKKRQDAFFTLMPRSSSRNISAGEVKCVISFVKQKKNKALFEVSWAHHAGLCNYTSLICLA